MGARVEHGAVGGPVPSEAVGAVALDAVPVEVERRPLRAAGRDGGEVCVLVGVGLPEDLDTRRESGTGLDVGRRDRRGREAPRVQRGLVLLHTARGDEHEPDGGQQGRARCATNGGAGDARRRVGTDADGAWGLLARDGRTNQAPTGAVQRRPPS